MEASGMHIGRVLVLFFLIFGVLSKHGVAVRALSTRDLEIRRYLKKMNKPAVKTIKSPTGELIDCVDIYKQPSLDHPLLRNHKLQLKPSFRPSDIHEEESSPEIPQPWHINGKCPDRTIPIRRILESDILRAPSLESFGKKYPPNSVPMVQSNIPAVTGNGHEHSVVYQTGGPYFGTWVDIELWNPRVEPNEFSLAQTWVISDLDLQNTIEAGLTVNFELYGDNKTRFFIFWTSDAYQSTGCYNMLCQGFVQTSNVYALNAAFSPVSKYNKNGYHVRIRILKDNQKHGNWWLTVQGKYLGYWPKELLPALQNGSKLMEWGGEVRNANYRQGSTTTQMGSGHFSGEGDRKAAAIRNIFTLDDNGTPHEPTDLQTIVENPKCYDLKIADKTDIYYGGPGKNPKCP